MGCRRGWRFWLERGGAGFSFKALGSRLWLGLAWVNSPPSHRDTETNKFICFRFVLGTSEIKPGFARPPDEGVWAYVQRKLAEGG